MSAPTDPAAPRNPAWDPLTVALAYAACSALWILFSDRALAAWFSDPDQFALASAVKGWAFTGVTAVLLFSALRRREHPHALAGAQPAATDGERPGWRSLAGRLALALALTVGLTAATIGYSVAKHQRQEHGRLQAVAELKVQQVADWLRERQVDARLLASGAALDSKALGARTYGPEQLATLEARLEALRVQTHFSSVRLLDAQGHTFWPVSAGSAATEPAGAEARAQLAHQRDTRLLGPYRGADGQWGLDIAVPLPDPAAAPSSAVPVLLLHLDARHILPPLLLHWPLPSQTGEVLVVRQDGGAIVSLAPAHPLRPASTTAPQLSLDDPQGLAAQAMQARSGPPQLLEGLDTAGQPALGVGLPVPGTDWTLLAQLGRRELHDAAIGEALWIVLAGALTLFVSASALYLRHQRRQWALVAQTAQAQRDKLQALGLLAALADSSDDAIFAKDLQGRYTLFNRAAGLFVGRPAADVLGLDDAALFPPEQAAMLQRAGRDAVVQDRLITQEEALDTAKGPRVFLASKGPLRDASGAVIGSFGISRDITALKAAETALRRANRALLTSRACGQAVLHAGDEQALLDEVCRILVHTGGYRMAWVGMAQHDAVRSVRPVAYAGAQADDPGGAPAADPAGYLARVPISWADDEHGRGPTGRAIREARTTVARHLLQDQSLGPWWAAAAERGFCSSVALPLTTDRVANEQACAGALCIYAAEAEAFDDEELLLVEELAADLSNGLRALHDRRERREALELLREQKNRLAESQRIAHVGSWLLDPHTQRLSCSDETLRLLGLDPAQDEPTLDSALALMAPTHRDGARTWLAQLTKGQAAHELEYQVTLPDGSTRVLSARGTLETDADGQPLRLVGTLQDVSALRAAEAERRAQELRYRELFASNPHPMWVYDCRTLAFIEVNDAAVVKYGHSRDEFLAMTLAKLRPAREQARLQAHVLNRELGNSRGEVWVHCLKDGREIEVEIHSHRLHFGGRDAVVVLAHDVTEQRQAQAQLRRLAQRAQALLQLPALADTLDEAAFVQRAVELAAELTGSPAAFVHRVDAEGQAPDAAQDHDACTEALRTHRPVLSHPAHAPAPLPDSAADLPAEASGITVPIIEGGRAVLLAGARGKAGGYNGLDTETLQLIGNDTWRLLQRRRADAALADSERSYRMLTEQVPAIIYRARLDAASTTTYISPAVHSLGWSVQEWLADPRLWLDSLHPEDRDHVLAELAAANEAQRGFDVQYRLRTRDGTWRHIHDKAEVVRNGAGQAVSLQGLMLDTTQRLQDEVELRKLYQAVEQSPNAIVITNLQAEIEYVNQAFLTSTGYAHDEVIGRNPRILQPENCDLSERRALWAQLTQGRPWTGEFLNRRKDGSTFVELAHIAPVRQADGRITHYVGVKEDITERKRISEELDRHRRNLEELVQARTAELAEARLRAEAASHAKSAFLANMSHEIRTPMNAIVGLSHLLQREQFPARQAARLAKIDGAAMHLLSLINGILDLSKIEAGKLALEYGDFDLAGLVHGVRALLADRALAKGVQVRVEIDATPTWLRGDATRLRQALLNYADNALKFTAHGEIRLCATLQGGAGEGPVLRLAVHDTGIGIAPDELPRLFRTFEQADTSTTRRFGGTGLGLALTRRLAELMGGEVGVDSEPGRGSCFWLTARLQPALSAAPTRQGPEPGQAETLLRARSAGRRVLLAEDDPTNREVAIELLEHVGLQVDTAEDGLQAVQMVQAAYLEPARRYDLLLLDVQMPHLDGFGATQQIRLLADGVALPILALTANAFDQDRQACLAAGMDDFVPKPVDPEGLYATLLRWLPPDGVAADAAPPAPRRSASAAVAGDNGAPPSAATDPADGTHPCSAADRARDRGPAPAAPPDDGLAALRHLPGLDVDHSLERLGGDPMVYRRLLQTLLTHHAEDARQIAEYVADGRWLDARGRAHQLKGAAGALGATAVQAAAAALEAALRAGRPGADLHALAQALCRVHEPLFRDLHDGLGRPAAPEGVEPSDPAALRAALDALQPLLATDDAASLDLLESLRGLLLSGLGAPGARLVHQIEHYDFPDALQTLQALRRALQGEDG